VEQLAPGAPVALMGPTWLDDALAAVMVAIAVYEIGRLSVAVATGRPSERDVDAFHLAMGMSMAAMLTGHLSPFAAEAWAVLFGGVAVWFACRVPWSVAAPTNASSSLGHRLSHVVSSGAMVFMLLAMAPSSNGAAMGAMGGAGHRLPVLAGGLAVLVVIGVFTRDGRHGQRGPTTHGANLEDDADTRVLGDPGGTGQTTTLEARTAEGAASFLAPRMASACEVAMGLTMAYMLLTLAF
jgi:hypothetical protein